MSSETHPLNSKWCFWHTPNITSTHTQQYGTWENANLKLTKNVHTFETVEMFWAVFNALPPATKISKEETIMFFRESVEPKWEDGNFKEGGRYLCRLDPVPAADKFIQTVIVMAIGEQISVETNTANLIGGIKYVKKEKLRDSHIRVEIWMTDKNKAAELLAVLKSIAADVGIENLTSHPDNCVFKAF